MYQLNRFRFNARAGRLMLRLPWGRQERPPCTLRHAAASI